MALIRVLVFFIITCSKLAQLQTPPSATTMQLSQSTPTPDTNVINTDCPTQCVCDNILRTVDCSLQGLTAIPSGIFEYTETLILDGNPLGTITSDFFLGLSNLNLLSLKDCSIVEIQSGAFDQLTNLQTLEIQQNMITDFGNVLNTLENLQVLKISQNKLPSLGRIMLTNLRKLEIFEAHNNEISSIDAETFQESPSLTHLYLPNCKLNNLNEETFINLINLNYLDISGNTNSILGPNIFQELLQLKYLYLSNMKVETINQDSFAQLANLEVLSLRNNYLRTVSKETFVHLTNLKYLLLEDNQWDCSCALKDFRTWDRLYTITSEYPWQCQEPEFLRNMIALNVDESEFGCEPWIYNLALDQTSGISNTVDTGKRAILSCEAVGQPNPGFDWTDPDGNSITAVNNNENVYISNNILIINSVEKKHEGAYTCTATNSKGSHSKKFTLVVTGTITEAPVQQCPLATIIVETGTITETKATLRWKRSFGADAIGYLVKTNIFGDEDSVTTKVIENIETEEFTVENLQSGTDYVICVSVELTGSCPSITTYEQCKEIQTTGLDSNEESLASSDEKHRNELIGTAIATFLGTLLILASIFVIIWRYNMPREFTKYNFKVTEDTTQFANMGDMPDTAPGFQEYGETDETHVTLASFNNVAYDGKIDAGNGHAEQNLYQLGRAGYEAKGRTVYDVNGQENRTMEDSFGKGKKTNGIRVK